MVIITHILIPNIWEKIWTVPFFLFYRDLHMWFLFIVSNTDTEINIWILLFIQIKSVCVCVCVEGSRSGMWSGVGQRCVSVIWSVSAVMRSFLLIWCCCTRLILMECVTLRQPTWMEKPTSNKGRWSVTCHSRWVASLSTSLSSSSLLSFFSPPYIYEVK